MKKLKTLILLFGICLSMAISPFNAYAGAYANPSVASYKIYSSYPLSSESLKIQITFSDVDAISPGTYQISIKNGSNELVLGEYTATYTRAYEVGISSAELYFYSNRNYIVGFAFVASEILEYEIPLEFFDGDSGIVSISIGGLTFRYNLKPLSYRKDEERIYFSLYESEVE